MADLKIELPAGLSAEHASAFREALAAMTGVEAAEESPREKTRSLDPQAVQMVVTTASAAIAGLNGLVPLIQQVLGLFKKKGIPGAKITLPNGTVIEADNMTADEVQQLVGGL